ncbi:MAG TPA: cupin domain-containing protein [Rhizobiaceae bacterium]|nr:cupin domain-containing protein [Rhizobiaceae bacterium]
MVSSSSQFRRPLRPVPVILAHNPLPNLWPVSLPGRPWTLAPGSSGRSPLEKAVAQFADSERFDSPIIVIADSAADALPSRMLNGNGNKPRIVAVPETTSAGVAATFAAMLAARESRSQPLMLFPANLRAADDIAFVRTMEAAAVLARLNERAVFMCRRSSAATRGVAFGVSEITGNAGARKVERVFRGSVEEDDRTAYEEMKSLMIPVGPVAVTAATLLDTVSEAAPNLLRACNNALQLGDETGNAVRPSAGFLSLAGQFTMQDVMVAHVERIVAMMAPTAIRFVTDWTMIGENERPAGFVPVRVSGFDTAVVVSAPEGVLFLQPGHEAAVATAPMVGGHLHLVSARTDDANQLLEEGAGFAVVRRTLAPHEATPPECHMHRSEQWHVVSGEGMAVIDRKQVSVSAGDTITLPATSFHNLVNTCAVPLEFYEFRSGLSIDEDDRLVLKPDMKKAG